jgi:integrase
VRRDLSEEYIDSLKSERKRYICMDKQVPWLGVRVSPRGKKSFVMVARFNSKHPTRRALGKLTLDAARDKARAWHRSLEQGIDPKSTKSKLFGDVAGDWFKSIKHHRRSGDAERIVRKRLKDWWSKPIASITKQDAVDAIKAVTSKGTLCAAHQLKAHMSRVFNYAIDNNLLEHSPVDRLRARGLIGERGVRQRVLTDDEVRRLWRASERIGYPYGRLWQLLLVTGQRRSDVAEACWNEFDIDAKLWTIPPERFKSNVSHEVPLSPLAIDLLKSIPRDDDEDRLFQVNGFSKAKKRLDRFMGMPSKFVIHDIRRTVRTRLSPLTTYEVAEMVVGHGRRGLARVYDQHKYVDEKREALDAWSERLSGIVSDSQRKSP